MYDYLENNIPKHLCCYLDLQVAKLVIELNSYVVTIGAVVEELESFVIMVQ